MDEDASHFSKCKPVQKFRHETDAQLAEINRDLIPPPVKQGIAPALSANGCATYWGTCERHEEINDKQWQLMGGDAKKKAHHSIQGRLAELDPRTKAREVM